MGEAENKQVIQRAFDAWAAGTYHSREEFLSKVIRPFNARMATPLVPKVHALYADGDTVIAYFDASATVRDGSPYTNTYTWYLGARVVVELHSESHATKPTTRAWAITRRAQRAHRRHHDHEQRGGRHQAGQVERPSPSGSWVPMPADFSTPTSSAARRGAAPTWSPPDSPSVHELANLLGELPSSRRGGQTTQQTGMEK